jgi:hypothetical protein
MLNSVFCQFNNAKIACSRDGRAPRPWRPRFLRAHKMGPKSLNLPKSNLSPSCRRIPLLLLGSVPNQRVGRRRIRRYTKLYAGASGIAEYGDPDDPNDWEFLGRISAHHNAVLTRRSLIATTASTPATPARWRRNRRRWATKPIFTSPPPAATATARATRSG